VLSLLARLQTWFSTPHDTVTATKEIFVKEECSMSAVEQKVRGFILENFMFTNDESVLSSEESLLEKGVIDSTGVMELVAFLEDEYQFQVNDDELVPENLDSVQNIVAFVGGKGAAS
jgi:acyl carrier protein